MRAPRAPLALICLAAAAVAVAVADARPDTAAATAIVQHPRFRFERPIAAATPGPSRLEVDLPLLAGAAPGLADLRLYDAAGSEHPYLLVPPAESEPSWREGKLLAILATKKESGFELDLGAPQSIDRLRLAGLPAPFLKRFRLEASGDRARWSLLVAEGTLFDLPEERLRLAEIAFAPGALRYLRLNWDDRSSGRLPLPGSVAARLVTPKAAATAPLRASLELTRRGGEPGRSRYRIRLPGPRLPLEALELAVASGNVLREARVLEPRLEGEELAPALLGRATLRRAERGDLVAAELSVPIEPPRGTELELVIEDGVNPPLELGALTAVFRPQPWIYFERTGEAAPALARFGDARLAAPRYDLEALRPSLKALAAAPAAWGERRPLEPVEAEAAQAPETLGGSILELTPFSWQRDILAAEAGLTAVALDASVLGHSRDLADLRILSATGHQLPYLLERLDEPLTLELGPPVKLAPRPADAPAVSRYRITLPEPELPAARLVLATRTRVFERELRLEIEREPSTPRDTPRVEIVATARFRHSDPDTQAAALVIELPARLASAELTLLVSEGDNSALPLEAVKLLLPGQRLRFFHAHGTHPSLLYGAPSLGAPRYDLALLAPRLADAPSHEVGLGTETRRTPAAARPAIEKCLFWGVLVAAAVVLLALLGRLLRPATSEAGGPS